MTFIVGLIRVWRKMAATEIVIMFIYFLMTCWRRQRRKCYRRRIRRMAAIRRRLQAFYDQQEEDVCEIIAALIADRIICSMMQCRCFGSRTEASPLPILPHLGTTLNGKYIFVWTGQLFSICALNLVGNCSMLAPVAPACAQQYLLKKEWLLH